MQNNSTQLFSTSLKETSQGRGATPSNRAIDFIRQFARTYRVLPTLSPSLGEVIVN